MVEFREVSWYKSSSDSSILSSFSLTINKVITAGGFCYDIFVADTFISIFFTHFIRNQEILFVIIT